MVYENMMRRNRKILPQKEEQHYNRSNRNWAGQCYGSHLALVNLGMNNRGLQNKPGFFDLHIIFRDLKLLFVFKINGFQNSQA